MQEVQRDWLKMHKKSIVNMLIEKFYPFNTSDGCFKSHYEQGPVGVEAVLFHSVANSH